MISVSEHRKSHILISGKQMAFVDIGPPDGETVLFRHGNPTSSYLWRNIMPHLADTCRCLAPDLIGMGDSEKLTDPGPESYTFWDHYGFLEAWVDAVIPDGLVTLVVHDWGSALGFHWASTHRDRVRGIAYMEAIVAPLSWGDWPKAATPVFKGLRSPAGEEMVLDQNAFVEQILPQSIIRTLEDEEMAVYRRPFSTVGEDRRPTLTWPRQIPIDGDPIDVHNLVSAYSTWMGENDLPKIFINAEPGAILRGRLEKICRSWQNQTEVAVPGIHFIQEDSPHEIGAAIATWYQPLRSPVD